MIGQQSKIDILVNNAGIANNEPAEVEDLKRFRQVIDINLTGTFICAQHCGRVMLKAGHGSIVNIASIMAERVQQALTNYAAAKAGVQGLAHVVTLSSQAGQCDQRK